MLAPMVSADPRLTLLAGFMPEGRVRFGGSRSDLFAITPCRALRTLSAATSSVGSSFPASAAPTPALRRSWADSPAHGPARPRWSEPSCWRAPCGHVRRPPLGQTQRPLRRRLAVAERGPGAVDQQGAQVTVASLGDTERAHPPAGAPVARHQAEPGRELPARAERCRIAHRGDGCRRREHADTGDLGNPPAGRVVPVPLRKATLDLIDLLIQPIQSRPLLAQCVHHHRRPDAPRAARAHRACHAAVPLGRTPSPRRTHPEAREARCSAPCGTSPAAGACGAAPGSPAAPRS